MRRRLMRGGLAAWGVVLFVTTSAGADGFADRLRTAEAWVRTMTDAVLPEEAGPEDYVRVGWRRSPELRAALEEWRAALQRVPQAFSLPDPRISYTEYIESVETRVGPQERAFSVSQKIPFPDKLWIRRRRAFQAAEAAYAAFEEKRLDLAARIEEMFYEYAYVDKAVAVMRENIALLKGMEAVVRRKYATGLSRNEDLLKLQVEIGRLESDLAALRDQKEAVASGVRDILHLPAGAALPLSEALLEAEPEAVETAVEDVRTRIEEANPRVRAMLHRVTQRREGLRLARRAYVPDLTLGVTTVTTGGALNPSTADSGKDPWMVTLSVNVPIWFPRLEAGVAEARASLEAARRRHADAVDDVDARAAMVRFQMRDAFRQARLYREELLPKVDQTLSALRAAYSAGDADFLSFIDAQRMVLQFQLAYYRFQATYHQRLAEWKALLGEEIVPLSDGPAVSEGGSHEDF